MNKTAETLIEKYENACNEILKAFAKKQGLDNYGWIAEEIGGTVCFGDDYFFNMDEIVFDVRTNQPKELIKQWQNDSWEFNKGKDNKDWQTINYQSYAKGLRFDQLKESNKEKPISPIDVIKKINDQF